METIQQVADCPCDQHQRAFIDALAGSDDLIFKVTDTNTPPVEGAHRVGRGEQIRLQQVNAQGHTFLLAFPGLDAACRHDPNATYVCIERDQALRMILGDANLEGILIATDNDAWAAAPRDRIAAVLKG